LSRYYFQHDDYLFTAPLELVKGATYTLKFKIGANAVAGTYWENGEQKTRAFEMSVLLAKEQNNSEESLLEPELSTVTYISDTETAGAFKEYSVDFKVEADGVYSIAFFDKSTHFLQDIAFRLDDIEITGVFPTPASVEGISAEPTEKGSRDIVVSFTAPAADLNGNPLETLEAVDIYRGSALIATLTEADGVAPGAELSYTDENAPRGFLSYSAVARNGQLSSPRAVTTVMSGLMNDLVISDITAPTFVNIDSKEEFKVTVFNNGADIALDYRVILLVDGVEAEALPGELIHTDEEITYTFEINWIDTSDEGTKLDYSAEIEFYGDENTENNKSDVYPVEFEYKVKNSVSDAAVSDIEISAANGTISVYAANGTPVSVYAADGRAICTGSTNGNLFTAKLHSGVYVVVAGNKTAKVTL
ncbi:MAG: hypothetical protein K2G24_05050, partial [Muribaculaceae bacterium]|nr:hypothetical protein [Muribaculaceae bacterium]